MNRRKLLGIFGGAAATLCVPFAALAKAKQYVYNHNSGLYKIKLTSSYKLSPVFGLGQPAPIEIPSPPTIDIEIEFKDEKTGQVASFTGQVVNPKWTQNTHG